MNRPLNMESALDVRRRRARKVRLAPTPGGPPVVGPTAQRLILVASSQAPLRDSLARLLRSSGYATLEAASGEQAFSQALTHAPHVVLYDVDLTDWDAESLTVALMRCQKAPLIAIAPRDRESERIAVLDAGASDCVDDVVSGPVLLARLRSVLRRSDPGAAGERAFPNGWRVNLVTRGVLVGQSPVHLTPREFGIFSVLAQHPGNVVPYRQLLADVWGAAQDQDLSALRVHMQQLREKLEADPRRPRFLLTAPGVGYCFEPGDAL